MVAARVIVDHRSPAEFAHPYNECVFEQSTVVEIRHQGCPGRVEHTAQVADGFEVILVRVPTGSIAVPVGVAQIHFDE